MTIVITIYIVIVITIVIVVTIVIIIVITITIAIIITRPKPAYGLQGLAGGIVGPEYSSSWYILGSRFAPPALSLDFFNSYMRTNSFFEVGCHYI